MNLKDELEKLCLIEKSFIDELFQDFFSVNNLVLTDLVDLSCKDYYNNCEIIKIEIKDWKNYNDFIEKSLEKITNYYLDWENFIEWMSNKDSINFVLKQLNHYTPINAISYSYIKSLYNIEVWEYLFSKWDDFIEYLEWLEDNNLRKNACNSLKNSEIIIKDIYSDEKYILSNGSIKTSRQILWHLHWDIGEFILFLLVEGFLRSPLLFSKIRHCKSSPQDKIKWSDWIHIELDDENNYLYNFLESKINKDFSSSLKQSIESNNEFLSNNWEWDINNEVTILFNNNSIINNRYDFLFNWKYNNYIVPYLNSNIKQENINFNLICLLWYNCTEYSNMKNNLINISDYIDSYSIERIKKILINYKKIEKNLSWKKVRIFMLPLIDELELIKVFLDKIKID